MTTLTVTTKGQITLRKELLQHLGVVPGDRVEVRIAPEGSVELRKAPGGELSDLYGMLKRSGRKPVTIEEMNETIAKGWAGLLDD